MSSKIDTKDLKTSGVGTFGEGLGGRVADRLFKVTPGHDAGYAMEQAAALLTCLYKMTLESAVDGDIDRAWETHYLTGMAKALVEDVAHGMMTGTVR